jgi:hemerythrin superfamily protein
MSTDAIVVLREDHRRVRKLFREFEAAGEQRRGRRGPIVRQILSELTAHTYVENEVMYPRVRSLLPNLEQDVLESYEEHHVADILCAELAVMDPGDERFDAKVTVLIENVTHHMDEEEKDWFPQVRAGLGRTRLREIGEEVIAAKARAPRSPSQPSALKKALDAVIA